MKKNLVRLFVGLLALVILCTQLPLGYLASADNANEPPTEYPARTVYKLVADMDYMEIIPKAEKTETAFINAVDFTSPDYDAFELDLFVDTGSAFTGTIDLAIYDEGGNQATYKLESVEPYRWLDIKIDIDDFVNDGIDFTKVVGYRINNPESYIRYVCANVCLTGIKAPNDLLDGDVVRLNKRIDLIDTNKSSAQSEIISFDEDESVDIYSRDWIEFDIYVLGTGAEAVSVTPSVTFVDSAWTTSSKFGNNTATLALNAKNGFALKTNEWLHVKVPSRTFTAKKCATDDIVGVMIAGMVNDYRYVVTNLALKTAVVYAPDGEAGVTNVVSGIFGEYYSEAANSATEFEPLAEVTDFSEADYIKVDVYADSASADVQNLKFNLKDANGKTATASFKLLPGNWVRAKFLREAFVAQTGFDMTKVASVNVSNLSKITRYFTANLRLGYADYAFSGEYPEDATLKFDTFEYNYFADPKGNLATDSLVSFDTTDFSAYDYVEFDVIADSQIDSAELPTDIKVTFVDATGKAIEGVKTYTYNSVSHVKILISTLSPKSGASLKTVSGIRLTEAVDNSRYVIKNLCLTKIVAPEAPTKDVMFSLLKYADVTTRNQNYFNSSITFDGLDPAYDPDLEAYDISGAEYIEFDYYMVVDEESPDYAPSYGVSMMLYDRTGNHGFEPGRARAGFTTNTNKWTHVRILISSFAPQNGNKFDPTKACRFFFDGSQKNARSIIANMVLGKRATLPVDEDKPEMPDKAARYVTNCDGANTTENGIWTSSGTYFTDDYKSEGFGSAALKVTNQETDSMNSHRFLFSSTADLSKSKNIKFDLFVDDMDLASTCDFKVYLSSDRRNSADNFVYFISPRNLKLGWNSFDIPLSEFKQEVASDSPAWDNIQCLAFEVILNKPFQDFGGLKEYFIFCVDNIRISDTFTLQAETEKNNTGSDEENSGDTSTGGSTGSERVETTITKDAEIITLTPEENTTYVTKRVIKKQKVLVDNIAFAHWIVLIITCCVAVVLIVGSLVLVILSSRKGKRGGSNQ